MPKPKATEIFGRPGQTNPNYFELGEDHAGMCKAMTANWIKLAKQHGIDGSSAVMGANQLLMTSIVQAGFLRNAKRFAILNAGLDTNQELYSQFSLKKTKIYNKTDRIKITGLALFRIMQSSIPNSENNAPHFCELRSTRHSMGVCIDPGKAVYLFDPNWGLYQANSDQEAERLFDHVQSYAGGDTPEWGYMVIDAAN